jgi:hypothetical protein
MSTNRPERLVIGVDLISRRRAMRTRALRIGGAMVTILALGACTAGSAEAGHAASGGLVAQFLLGFWHGLIGPVTLIGEIINRFLPHLLPWQVRLYETKASGVAYDVGFYLGLAGGPSFALGRRRR